jgi:hypothetical protein
MHVAFITAKLTAVNWKGEVLFDDEISKLTMDCDALSDVSHGDFCWMGFEPSQKTIALGEESKC